MMPFAVSDDDGEEENDKTAGTATARRQQEQPQSYSGCWPGPKDQATVLCTHFPTCAS